VPKLAIESSHLVEAHIGTDIVYTTLAFLVTMIWVDRVHDVASVTYLNAKTAESASQKNISTFRQSVVSFLSAIPEPAAQAAAFQLLKTRSRLDRSVALCVGLVGLAILEEMV